ncbi:hypothetical protein BD410DRAFT_450928 [Rickenella mellea]|uniref:Uncharacterized protein n=1 Tax=Rickenella mellea TaxID=50990 RepID=A0A4Y7PVR2_9AGAM|nr:hypothetical protein BD410DRAFT_450928 [Rickenella mellea]
MPESLTEYLNIVNAKVDVRVTSKRRSPLSTSRRRVPINHAVNACANDCTMVYACIYEKSIRRFRGAKSFWNIIIHNSRLASSFVPLADVSFEHFCIYHIDYFHNRGPGIQRTFDTEVVFDGRIPELTICGRSWHDVLGYGRSLIFRRQSLIRAHASTAEFDPRPFFMFMEPGLVDIIQDGMRTPCNCADVRTACVERGIDVEEYKARSVRR